MCMQLANDSTSREGHVVFVGTEGVLFHDYDTKRSILLKRDEIKMLFEPQHHLGDLFDRFLIGRKARHPRCIQAAAERDP
jgi:hypothetical protein